MNRTELRELIRRFEEHCETFHSSAFVVSGDARTVEDLLKQLTLDEIFIPEKDS